MGRWLYSHLQKVKCQKWNTTEHKILSEVFNFNEIDFVATKYQQITDTI